MLRQSLHSAQMQSNSSTDLNEGLRYSGAPPLTTTLDAQLFEYYDPHSRIETAAYNSAFHDIYPAILPSTTISQAIKPQLPVDNGDDINTPLVASRERIQKGRLNPLSVGSTSKVMKMTSKRRKVVPAKGVTGRANGKKVDVACTCCR